MNLDHESPQAISQTAHSREALDCIVRAFEAITPQSVASLGDIYCERVHFKDPFNDVHGLAAVQRIFDHMFVALQSPRFIVTRRVVDGTHCFLVWEFRFFFRGFGKSVEQCVVGSSSLQLTAEGKILEHRDYWDAAEELYEKMPILGGLMAWLRRRMSVSQSDA